jgi:hypothetical protein
MADRADVPSTPLVTIAVDDNGRLTVNGHEVPPVDGVDPGLLGTEVVCSDFAKPLGRPVRATAVLPHEQIQMVIHPDGRVTDVGPHQPATPAGVPPATRTQGSPLSSQADRIAAEISAARRAGRRPRHQLVVAGAGMLAAATTLVVVWDQRGPALEKPSEAAHHPAAADVPPAQSVVESTRIRPFAVSGVRADADPGVLRLSLTALRRTTARVVVTSLEAASSAQRLSVSVGGETTRLVTLPELSPGRYEWTVHVPGQPEYAGTVRVPEPPVVEVATVDVAEETPDRESRDSGGTTTQVDPPRPIGVGTGPDYPVDPDGD